MHQVVTTNWPVEWLTRQPVPRTPWEEIFQLSLPAIEHDEQFPFGAYYLKELRTIRMGSGRQNGKTGWALEKLDQIPESIVIVRDKPHREAMLPQVRRRMSMRVEAGEKDPLGAINHMIDQFHAKTLPRVFTCLDLKAQTFRSAQEKIDLKMVIIDDASQNTKLFDIYGHLARLQNPNLVIVALG